MKVRIRDDESNEGVGTWTLCFPIRPRSRRERDEEWIFRLLYMLVQIERLELADDVN